MFFFSVGYTGVFNVLDYSCLSFPTGLAVDKAIDRIEELYQPLGSDCEAINGDCEYLPPPPEQISLRCKKQKKKNAYLCDIQ